MKKLLVVFALVLALLPVFNANNEMLLAEEEDMGPYTGSCITIEL